LKITSVNVRRIEKEGSRMKAIASVLLDDSFAVHDIRVIEGDNGLFIAMPSRKTATGGYRDIVHPINQEVRKMFEDAILNAYHNEAEPAPTTLDEDSNVEISETENE
jgi:stage V sporulation protein G